MLAEQFVRDLAVLLEKYNIDINTLRQGIFSLNGEEIDLNTFKANGSDFEVLIKKHHVGNTLPDKNALYVDLVALDKVLKRCHLCGSSLKRKWFGLITTDRCSSKICPNFQNGFEIISNLNDNTIDRGL